MYISSLKKLKVLIRLSLYILMLDPRNARKAQRKEKCITNYPFQVRYTQVTYSLPYPSIPNYPTPTCLVLLSVLRPIDILNAYIAIYFFSSIFQEIGPHRILPPLIIKKAQILYLQRNSCFSYPLSYIPNIKRQLQSDFLHLLILKVIYTSAKGPLQQINIGA